MHIHILPLHKLYFYHLNPCTSYLYIYLYIYFLRGWTNISYSLQTIISPISTLLNACNILLQEIMCSILYKSSLPHNVFYHAIILTLACCRFLVALSSLIYHDFCLFYYNSMPTNRQLIDRVWSPIDYTDYTEYRPYLTDPRQRAKQTHRQGYYGISILIP